MSDVKHVGVSFDSLLFLLFLTLKLSHVIDWSWWWVTCPLWGGALFVIAICIVLFSIFVIQEYRKL